MGTQAAPAMPRVVQPRATKPLRQVLEKMALEFRCFARRAGDIDDQTADGIDALVQRYDAATKSAPPKPRRGGR